ncbi:MAG: ABC transporter permease [Ilumatobacteraceae bacterium]
MTWLTAILRRRVGHVVAMATGIALAVGLLASLGAFLSASKSTMTRRSIATVAVDWQVEAQQGADASAVASTIRATDHVTTVESVAFAVTTGFESSHGGTTQTTGPGVVVGVDESYRASFPAQFRDLLGRTSGVLLYQQTAANLGASPGDTIMIGRAGLPAAAVTVDGVIDIPQSDSLFQAVGAPIGAQPLAPPDNVLVVPTATWHTIFDPLAATRADLAHTQIHVRLDHRLPNDPSSAFSEVTGQANNLEAKLAGAGRVGDNLAAALSAARSDAVYAQVLFLFLGTPGAVLAGLLTATVASSGRERRRRDFALLRVRGASTNLLTGLGTSEAVLVGLLGGVAGLVIAQIVGRVAFGTGRFGATTGQAVLWSGAAFAVGLLVAVVSVAVPARLDARQLTVAAARLQVGRRENPRWMRYGLDIVLLAAALVVFWLSSRNGYHLVLAVEGVPTISVSYWALGGPALLWLSVGLLTYRLTTAALSNGRAMVGIVLRPLAGSLSGTVAASLRRQRRYVARGAALVALTVGFAVSTAVFNATYQQQGRIDAVLSNGADVTVTTGPGSRIGPNSAVARQIARAPGVRHSEPIQHRFAYVGADLQDLFGVEASTVIDAGRLQNAYFQGGTASSLMATLGSKPDSLLVSAETVHDFQLLPGDPVTLRLQDATTKQFIEVPFHYVGVVKEFPTAPRDSFLIANAGYIARMTNNDAVGAFLVDTGGSATTAVAAALRTGLGTSATVTDLVSARAVVGSSLTAVDLAGLTKVELSFALVLAAAATGLTLWLGLAERRRTFVIAAALGANRRQLGGFVWSEAAVVTTVGLCAGALGAWALARMLVKVLTGVFDPPPEVLSIPWTYLGTVAVIALGSTFAAALSALRHARSAPLEELRTS